MRAARDDLPMHATIAPPLGGEKVPPLRKRWAPLAARADHRAAFAANARGPSVGEGVRSHYCQEREWREGESQHVGENEGRCRI